MEDCEQNNKENRYAPYFVRQNLVRSVRPVESALHRLFPFSERGGKVLCYVFVAAVRHQRLEIVSEHVVPESILEGSDRFDSVGVRLCFQLVLLRQLDRVEKRIFNLLSFQRDFYVADKMT